MRDFGERFSKLFEEVKACSALTIFDIQWRPFSYDESELEETASLLRSMYGFAIPEEMKEALMLPSELSLSWGHSLFGELEAGGGFRLFNIFEAVQGNKLKIYNEDLPESIKVLYPKTRYFDRQPDGPEAVFLLDEGKMSFDVWLHDEGDFFKMDIDYLTYLDMIILTKGTYYWQYLFCDKKTFKNISFYKKEYIDKLFKVLHDLFPGYDYSILIERYNALRKSKGTY